MFCMQVIKLTKEQFIQCNKEETKSLFFRRQDNNDYYVKPVSKYAISILSHIIKNY